MPIHTLSSVDKLLLTKSVYARLLVRCTDLVNVKPVVENAKAVGATSSEGFPVLNAGILSGLTKV